MFIFSNTFMLLIHIMVVIGDGERKIRLIRSEDAQEKAPPHYKNREMSHESSPNFVKKLLDSSSSMYKDAGKEDPKEATKEVFSDSIIWFIVIGVVITLACVSQCILHIRNGICYCILPPCGEQCLWETKFPN